jgi:hypothetical protein
LQPVAGIYVFTDRLQVFCKLTVGNNIRIHFYLQKKKFYSEVPGKVGWSYIVRYDPRGRPVKYNHVVEHEDNNEEEDHDYAYQEQVFVVDVSNEEAEEVDHPNVGDDDLIDDIDNYISKNDIDDDVDMNEPFTNIDSEPDLDRDVELDEEEDE